MANRRACLHLGHLAVNGVSPYARWLRKARAALRDLKAAPPCDGDTLALDLARAIWRVLDPEGYRKAVKRG